MYNRNKLIEEKAYLEEYISLLEEPPCSVHDEALITQMKNDLMKVNQEIAINTN